MDGWMEAATSLHRKGRHTFTWHIHLPHVQCDTVTCDAMRDRAERRCRIPHIPLGAGVAMPRVPAAVETGKISLSLCFFFYQNHHRSLVPNGKGFDRKENSKICKTSAPSRF